MAACSSTSSSGEQQQYSLRWNDYQASIMSSFRHLRDQEDFVDVTLACDSGSYTAHKVVLSACSPYFRRLLKANPCQHPIVILRDVASSDMESLLRFMYHGEVHVGQKQLAAFLKTARMLQIKGLADVDNYGLSHLSLNTSNPISHNSEPVTPRDTWPDLGDTNERIKSPPQKRSRSFSPILTNHVKSKSDALQDSLLGQALEGGPTIHTPTNNIQAQSTGDDSNSASDNEEDTSNNESMLNSVKTEPNEVVTENLEHHRNAFPASLLGLQGLMPGPSGIHAANQDPNFARRSIDILRVRATDPRPCPKCGKIYRSAHTLRTHLEDKHTICPGYRCVLCGTVAKSRNSLHSHMSRQHRGISTKDLPVLPMPSPFDPDLASKLLAKAGVNVSAAELKARASPTGPRRNDIPRLELPRGAPSDTSSSVCGGDDPEDLTLPLSIRYNNSPTPNNNTVITKVANNHSQSNSNGRVTPGNLAVKALNNYHNNHDTHLAPYHHALVQQQQQQQQQSAVAGSAIIDTFFQMMVESSGGTMSQEQAMAAYALRMANMNALEKLTNRSNDDYSTINRDDSRRNHAGEDHVDAESSGAEEDYSDTEEQEVVKAD